MFTKILQALKNEPALVNGLLALAATALMTIVDVISLNGGEWVAILSTVLAAAGITRQEVTPTRKL